MFDLACYADKSQERGGAQEGIQFLTPWVRSHCLYKRIAC